MYFSHLNTAVQLLQQYNGDQPFGNYIKQYFNANKKYGSKDRKNISQMCYAYFRLGNALLELPTDERILTGIFYTTQQQLKPDWSPPALNIGDIFPWKEALSNGIDHEAFCQSFLTQPDLFLRLRPGKEQTVKTKLQQAGISFKEIISSCLALPNASKADAVVEMDKEAVIQDYSSQRVGEFLKKIKAVKVWDACAASGGKSMLANDILPQIKLTVSDIRESIISNLQKRFAAAGIKNYRSIVADLATSTAALHNETFDLIIADVPCSGSGTWSRTPEQLYNFRPSTIERYSNLQKKILGNVIPHLKPGGHLLYITCSVFEKENEGVVEFVKEKLQLQDMELLKGYNLKADTMFAAVFTLQEQPGPTA
jgi:16S rRNA (cytosine967-C5)-methyltransferase